MGLFDGKKGLIMGVANDRSIAWAIAETIMQEGGECGFTHLPDHPYERRRRTATAWPSAWKAGPRPSSCCRWTCRTTTRSRTLHADAPAFGKIDFLLHSIAFADRRDLNRDTVKTSRAGFKLAMDVSVYSLIAVANAARRTF